MVEGKEGIWEEGEEADDKEGGSGDMGGERRATEGSRKLWRGAAIARRVKREREEEQEAREGNEGGNRVQGSKEAGQGGGGGQKELCKG